MERSRRIIFVSHCILNQNTVVEPLARAAGPYKDIIRFLLNKGVGIHQLPCPEFRYLGLQRRPMTVEEYDTPAYCKLCRRIAEDTVNIMKEYLRSGYSIAGLIGINHSPTCSIKGKKGLFMEELEKILSGESINPVKADVPTDYHDGENSAPFIKELENGIFA